jgi:hypothetical protein
VTTTRTRPCRLFAAALILPALASALAAQYPPGTQPPPQQPPLMPGILAPNQVRTGMLPQPLRSTWVQPQDFQGFPTFPPNLGGYGAYPPPPPGFLAPPDFSGALPPPLTPRGPDWPAWIERKRGTDLPYEAGTAVLVRQSDRVWVRAAGDDAFVPLYHYDNVRALQAGADVQVRHLGQLQLMLYGGSRVAAYGVVDFQVVELGEMSARLRFHSLSRLLLVSSSRGLACVLPDGSEVIIDALPPDAPTERAQIYIERPSEPVQYRGRATILNAGSRPARWRTPLGERVLEPGRRVTLFLDPSATPLPAALSTDRVGEGQADGARRRWQGEGAVTWSGARFQLQDGARLELDPLLGDPFAPAEPEREPERAPTPSPQKQMP